MINYWLRSWGYAPRVGQTGLGVVLLILLGFMYTVACTETVTEVEEVLVTDTLTVVDTVVTPPDTVLGAGILTFGTVFLDSLGADVDTEAGITYPAGAQFTIGVVADDPDVDYVGVAFIDAAGVTLGAFLSKANAAGWELTANNAFTATVTYFAFMNGGGGWSETAATFTDPPGGSSARYPSVKLLRLRPITVLR